MPKVQAAVKAIIAKDNKFLVIKQLLNNGHVWELPGGRIEHNSTPEKCLKREVLEETGLVIEIKQLMGAYYFFRQDNNDQIICLTFFCELEDKDVDLSLNIDPEENIVDFKWVTKDELLDGNFKLPHQSFVELIKNINI